MWFNFFKHKNKNIPKEYEGRFVTENEIYKMTNPKKESMIESEMKEINKMLEEMKQMIN